MRQAADQNVQQFPAKHPQVELLERIGAAVMMTLGTTALAAGAGIGQTGSDGFVRGLMIGWVGPDGAGKSRTGSLLAERLGVPFVDLDERFAATVG